MDSSKLAEWLVIGFKRAWLMRDVLVAAGLADVELTDLHERHPFLPPDALSLKRPVRAFVAAEWPKLAAFLCKHEGDSAKLLSVIPQLQRLKAKGVRGDIRSASDIKEQAATRRESRAESSSYRISRESFKSHQRSAWSVCK